MIGDNVHFTTIYMPLVRTPMIAPTSMYDAFPTLSPDEAGTMICDSIIDRPKRKATRLGTFGEVLYALSPQTVDQVMNTPTTSSRTPRPRRRARSRTDGKPAELEKQDEMSTEAVAMAYLMRGIHF